MNLQHAIIELNFMDSLKTLVLYFHIFNNLSRPDIINYKLFEMSDVKCSNLLFVSSIE